MAKFDGHEGRINSISFSENGCASQSQSQWLWQWQWQWQWHAPAHVSRGCSRLKG